jgi:membrane protein
MSNALRFLQHLYHESRDDGLLRRSAAVAYYAVFSLPAFLLVVFSIARVILRSPTVDVDILQPVRLYMGDQTAQILQDAATNVQSSSATSGWPAFIGGIVLLFSALGFVRELQASLNQILKLNPVRATPMQMIVHYFSVIAPLLFISCILIASLVLSAVLVAFEHRLETFITVPFDLLQFGNYVLILVSLTAIFTVLYTALPARGYPLKRVLLCAFGASFCLLIGSIIVAEAAVFTSMGAMYGVAAGLLVLLFWIFFCANVFFVGAECIDLLSRTYKKTSSQ